MTLENNIKGATEGPFKQFEDCKHADVQCQWKNVLGQCIYETCIYDNEWPPTIPLMKDHCVTCNEIYYRDPREMKIRMCDSCIKRMHAAEVLPFTCELCGRSQNKPSRLFMSKICDVCVDHLSYMMKNWDRINRSMHCGNCGN